MRIVIIALMLFFSVSMSGQAKPERPEVLVEYQSISIGESFAFDDYEIQFDNVLSDSRCPKAVMCVVAGEAVGNVAIYKSGELISETELTFTPITYLPNQKGNLFDADDFKVTGVELWPYPKAGHPIPFKSYKLKLLIEEIIK
ncbi:MAG: hypothetical protein EVB11_00725 [Winogradskyella sp.]|nr:MAG: hypothetical protein EVB11_00725 [Winogradskyella sp.]